MKPSPQLSLVSANMLDELIGDRCPQRLILNDEPIDKLKLRLAKPTLHAEINRHLIRPNKVVITPDGV